MRVLPARNRGEDRGGRGWRIVLDRCGSGKSQADLDFWPAQIDLNGLSVLSQLAEVKGSLLGRLGIYGLGDRILCGLDLIVKVERK